MVSAQGKKRKAYSRFGKTKQNKPNKFVERAASFYRTLTLTYQLHVPNTYMYLSITMYFLVYTLTRPGRDERGLSQFWSVVRSPKPKWATRVRSLLYGAIDTTLRPTSTTSQQNKTYHITIGAQHTLSSCSSYLRRFKRFRGDPPCTLKQRSLFRLRREKRQELGSVVTTDIVHVRSSQQLAMHPRQTRPHVHTSC